METTKQFRDRMRALKLEDLVMTIAEDRSTFTAIVDDADAAERMGAVAKKLIAWQDGPVPRTLGALLDELRDALGEP